MTRGCDSVGHPITGGSSCWPMFTTAGVVTLAVMTITIESMPAPADVTTDTVVLDGGLFFQPLPVTNRARELARAGVGVAVTVPLTGLDSSRLTGVTRTLLAASVESRLRQALLAAGFRHVERRADVAGAVTLHASP